MNRAFLVFAAIILLTTFVQAQDAPASKDTTPLPPQAHQAEIKFSADMQKLDADYQQKAIVIKQAYVDGLKVALKNLAQQDNPDPDQIAKLSAKIKDVQAMATPPNQLSAPAPAQAPKIIGKWKVEWPGGSDLCTFNNDNTSSYGVWLQDGFKVIHVNNDGRGTGILVLSHDGKIMVGNFGNHVVTYTYLGS